MTTVYRYPETVVVSVKKTITVAVQTSYYSHHEWVTKTYTYHQLVNTAVHLEYTTVYISTHVTYYSPTIHDFVTTTVYHTATVVVNPPVACSVKINTPPYKSITVVTFHTTFDPVL